MLTAETSEQIEITPARIMQAGFAFWSSKVLLTAIGFELFTHLCDCSKTAADIKNELQLHGRGLEDFLDTLVAMGFITRSGDGPEARYLNTPDTDMYLNKNRDTYMGGMLEMLNNRLYTFWGNLDEALKTGKPQNEVAKGGAPIFDSLYEDENRLKEFVGAMGSIQAGNFNLFANQFDFSEYGTHMDVGGAGGDLSIQIALAHPDIRCTVYDLPQVGPIAKANIAKRHVEDRVQFMAGDFFKDPLPHADLITMGNILHDWGLDDKKMLIRKAFEALPTDGALVVIENTIDDERRQNVFGLLMSLNMLIETPAGFDYTAADFTRWAIEAGFKDVATMPLTGPATALIAYK
ncbi:methyltransferase [Taibaiella soli]|uniref:Methyltransferase n=1 Tax=Taibaiella soli TaxID=1649169 RepID=A0A2W2B3D5_9BACT|nr:methyltransferase [Taibaiella soli]PZF70749.1 methyltransferase [Taibaiella soli]